MIKPSISFFTLGCRLNQSETAVIQNTFKVEGYRIVSFEEPADVVVINTCTVTENGDAETRRLVNKINRLNPQTRIALIGCQAQVQKEKLAQLSNVRWVVGNSKKMDLASIIGEIDGDEGQEAQVIVPAITRESFTVSMPSIDATHTRANIKIQDGCDFFCSFCEIPYARGRARSRVFEDITLEARALVAAGYKEIILTGINLGTYAHSQHTIVDVIEALEEVDGLERIRISSIEPTTIPKKLITKMAKKGKLCRYLHIPLQSGHNDILTAMKRKYTFEEFSDFLQEAHARVAEICIGTDVIVGFPGESDKHFEETAENLRELPIHYFHTFSYSQRQMAKSQNLSAKLPALTIQRRSEHLRNLSQNKRKLFHESLINSTQKVIVEGKKEGYWSGLTDNYIRVYIPSDLNLKNQFCAVQLKELRGEGVLGNLCAGQN